MRESRTYGSVRGALSNGRPYRVKISRRKTIEPPMTAPGQIRLCWQLSSAAASPQLTDIAGKVVATVSGHEET
jgi:hypothetical protein